MEYNYVSLVYDIIELIDSKLTDSKKKEGPPWAWNTVFAEIIGEYEDEDESIFYASLEPGQVVLCKVFDHLRNTLIQEFPSGASLILSGGTFTRRIAYPNARILIDEPI